MEFSACGLVSWTIKSEVSPSVVWSDVMTWLARFALIAGLALAPTASAQTTGTTTTTTGISTTSGGVSGFGSSTPGNLGTSTLQQETAPQISSGTTTGANVSGYNIFSGYYANPFYQGRPGSMGIDGPGGFGTPLAGTASGNTGMRTGSNTLGSGSRNTGFGTANRNTSTANLTGTGTGLNTGTGMGATRTTGGGTQIQSAGGMGLGGTFGTGTTGRTTGFGQTGFGQTGFGQMGRNTGFGQTGLFGGMQQQQQGVLAQQARAVSYSVAYRNPAPRPTPTQITSDLRGTIDRSSYLTNPRAIDVNHDGQVVTLRGTVKDEEEARTAEGIVRLTPGVRAVKNELTWPKPVNP